jgi:NAD(P)-dependent dehydrogenase (short-subunit alcohol dehydrogenase family)
MNTVVITGVSRGLGLVTAEKFLEKGWHVIGTGRSEPPKNLHKSIEYYQFDAANADACASFWKEVAKEHDSFSLVNNAGGYVSGNVIDTPVTDFQNQMASNYFASVFMTQCLLKSVPKAKIINIISTGALEVHPGQSAYGASKTAIAHFFQSLRGEINSKDYQITNIYPSDIAAHGTDEDAIDPIDLASFIINCAERKGSLVVSDVTVRPNK